MVLTETTRQPGSEIQSSDIIICSYSPHSKKAINQRPYLNESIMRKFYGYGIDEEIKMAWRNRHILQKEVDQTLKKYSGPFSKLNRISLRNFFKETKLDIFIWSCKMGAVDCTLLWEPIDTFLGVCHRLQPSKVQARSFFVLNKYLEFYKIY